MKLLLAGDVMTGRGIDQVLPHPGSPLLFESWVRDAREYVRLAEAANGAVPAPVDFAYPWGEALQEIAAAAPDLRIANLETAVTASDDAWPGKGIHYRMHPANAPCLAVPRLDACTLANNHVLDWGRDGLAQTLQALDSVGIRTAGAGADEAGACAPRALPLPGGARLLLSAWATESSGVPRDWAAGPGRSGIALLPDLGEAGVARVAQAVAAARRPGDRVLVSLHWGGNWGFELPAAHRSFARALLDLGVADVIHGHSSHHPLPIEVHRGRAILYGCGDLLNDYEGIGAHGSLRGDVACLYLLTLADDGALQRLEIVPLRLRRLRLERADAAAARWLRDLFDREGRRLGTAVTQAPDGHLLLQWAR